jgi:hypothetical protein
VTFDFRNRASKLARIDSILINHEPLHAFSVNLQFPRIQRTNGVRSNKLGSNSCGGGACNCPVISGAQLCAACSTRATRYTDGVLDIVFECFMSLQEGASNGLPHTPTEYEPTPAVAADSSSNQHGATSTVQFLETHACIVVDRIGASNSSACRQCLNALLAHPPKDFRAQVSYNSNPRELVAEVEISKELVASIPLLSDISQSTEHVRGAGRAAGFPAPCPVWGLVSLLLLMEEAVSIERWLGSPEADPMLTGHTLQVRCPRLVQLRGNYGAQPVVAVNSIVGRSFYALVPKLALSNCSTTSGSSRHIHSGISAFVTGLLCTASSPSSGPKPWDTVLMSI